MSNVRQNKEYRIQHIAWGYKYRESQFNREDYRVLFNIASPHSGLKSRIHNAKYRDKKIQRSLISKEECKVFLCPLDELPLYLHIKDAAAQDIIKWRLHINK
jgi:hypothetical protein